MPRLARTYVGPGIYHVLCRGNNLQNVFHYRADFECYLEILKKYKEKYNFLLYNYVLMDNHTHKLIETTKNSGSLSEIMKGINLSYAQYYKKKYKHIGHLWQDRFRSIIVSKDNYLLACASYIELNPVRAGLVSHPEDYQWSSFKVYAYGKEDEIIDISPVFKSLADSSEVCREKYKEFVEEMLIKKKAQKGEMNRRILYGSKEFLKEMKNSYSLKDVINKRGRPW